MSRGIKTTEFWVTLITTNVLLFGEAFGLNLNETTVMSVTGAVIAYVGGRTWAKKSEKTS